MAFRNLSAALISDLLAEQAAMLYSSSIPPQKMKLVALANHNDDVQFAIQRLSAIDLCEIINTDFPISSPHLDESTLLIYLGYEAFSSRILKLTLRGDVAKLHFGLYK